MKLKEFSPTLVFLLLASILAGISIYLNTHKKSLSNESKNQLTAPDGQKKKDSRPVKLEKWRSFFNRSGISKEQISNPEQPPVITQERFYTEKEIQNMSKEEFRSLLLETESRLPTLSDIKNVPAGALHRTPEPILNAGKNLGLLKEILNAHPDYETSALGFYENCARNGSRPTPVRALCLTNLVEIKKKNHQPLNLKEFPVQVVDLARLITDL